jgi:hypothetical protein
VAAAVSDTLGWQWESDCTVLDGYDPMGYGLDACSNCWNLIPGESHGGGCPGPSEYTWTEFLPRWRAVCEADNEHAAQPLSYRDAFAVVTFLLCCLKDHAPSRSKAVWDLVGMLGLEVRSRVCAAPFSLGQILTHEAVHTRSTH